MKLSIKRAGSKTAPIPLGVLAAMLLWIGTISVVHADYDGMLDPTFAATGAEYIDWPGYLYDNQFFDVPVGVFARADGTIVAVSAVNYGPQSVQAIGVARLTEAGTLDTSFGDGTGQVVISPTTGIAWIPQAATLLGSGELVVVGSVQDGNATYAAVWEITPDGALDPTFGTDGYVLFDRGVATPDDGATAVVAGDGSNEPQGTLFIAGYTSNGSYEFISPAIFFLAADGTPLSRSLSVANATLANGGRYWAGPGACPSDTTSQALYRWRSIAFNAQYFLGNSTHYLVVAGDCGSASTAGEIVVAALGSLSNLDPTFGANGVSYLSFGAVFDEAADRLAGMAVSYDITGAEQITLAGTKQLTTDDNIDFGAARLKSNGQFDTSFGNGGHIVINVGACCGEISDTSSVYAMLVQRDGKTLLGGATVDSNGVASRALVRLNPDGSGDTTFGTTGALIGGRIYREAVSGSDYNDYITAMSFMSGEKILQTGPTFASGNNIYTGLARLQNDSIFVGSFDALPVPPTGAPR
jgi:uncharacterized delta-60 repeat protein